MPGDVGQWDVDVSSRPDVDAITLDFRCLGENGVESFNTVLPRESAIALASAILNATVDLRCECP